MSNPFFSIIVVCLNAEDSVRETVNSVLKQNFTDFEVVVKDGLSKDKTLEEVPVDERVKVYSLADKSLYDAMNQAIERATGRFLCFLNCGDFFANENVLAEIYKKAIEDKEERKTVYGNYARKGVVYKQPSALSKFYLYRTPLCHQTMFFAKKLFEENGLYDTSLKILADYDHTLHDFTSGAKFAYCDTVVCDYMGGGVSESEKGRQIKKQEYKVVREKYFSKSEIRKFELKLKLSMRGLRQKMASDNAPYFIRKLYRFLVNKVNR